MRKEQRLINEADVGQPKIGKQTKEKVQRQTDDTRERKSGKDKAQSRE